MVETLESTIVLSLGKDKEKEFERITTQLGNNLKTSVPNSKSYDVWIAKEGNKGFIRQRSEDSKSMINYHNELKKNLIDLQKTGQVINSYLFGTADSDVIKSAEMLINNVKPTMYNRHIVSIKR